MKKLFSALFLLAMIFSLAGCSPEAAPPTTEQIKETTAEQTEMPTPEPTLIPTTEPTVLVTPETVKVGEPKEVTFRDISFTYNDKYGFKEDSESDMLTITYVPTNTWVNVFYAEKALDVDGEALLWHGAYYSSFETQSLETNNIDVAGIDSICTLAYIKISDDLPWMYYSLVTVPSSKGFVSFAFYSVEDDELEGYVDAYWEMLETIKLIEG